MINEDLTPEHMWASYAGSKPCPTCGHFLPVYHFRGGERCSTCCHKKADEDTKNNLIIETS